MTVVLLLRQHLPRYAPWARKRSSGVFDFSRKSLHWVHSSIFQLHGVRADLIGEDLQRSFQFTLTHSRRFDSSLPPHAIDDQFSCIAIVARVNSTNKALAFQQRQHVVAVFAFLRRHEGFETIVEIKQALRAFAIANDGIERRQDSNAIRRLVRFTHAPTPIDKGESRARLAAVAGWDADR